MKPWCLLDGSLRGPRFGLDALEKTKYLSRTEVEPPVTRSPSPFPVDYAFISVPTASLKADVQTYFFHLQQIQLSGLQQDKICVRKRVIQKKRGHRHVEDPWYIYIYIYIYMVVLLVLLIANFMFIIASWVARWNMKVEEWTNNTDGET